ncbi:MarR family winged helix-turn-helix transcriptional regulator [Weeksella sp. HMSC059D05]|uniref:MarR family winged helix-turn-helix transcriptional regulator n=2 Tax=Weeksella TaxID=1013 RepID=UPI0008A345B5|nr:MarR family transcriptional regulator [Weeksella sp. HMSC059D05]MDK7375615.1 MarR family transcriptional regulator [Weeksella virosa]OFM81580.1 MarR family transcriptional regulator [Weeksella sp. HMSC059D05]
MQYLYYNMVREDLTIDYLLRTTWLAVQKMYNEQASKYESTMVYAFTLLSIDPKNGTPSTSLGPKMGIEPTSLSRTLNKLEARNFIERIPNPEDGRSVLVTLTKEGLRMRDISRQTVFQFNEVITNNISPERLKVFLEVMYDINRLISDKKIFKNNYEKTH